MAENVVINIEANTQGLDTTIQLLTKLGVLEQKVADDWAKSNAENSARIKKSTDEAVKGFDKLSASVKSLKADNGLAKTLDVSAVVVKSGNSVASLKTQLKEAVREAQDLADTYGELDVRTVAAAKKAAELKDKIGDVNTQIAALTPEGKFKAIQNLAGTIAGVFQVATGALQAFGVENERATKIAQQFQGALNIFGGLSQLSQLTDSLTAVKTALGLTTAATEAQAAANVLEGETAEGAAAANTTFAASLSATGIGTIVVALGALAGALLLIGSNSEESAAKQKKLNEQLANTKVLRAASAKELKEAQIDLDVVSGKISKEEGERRKLGLDFVDEQKKKYFDLFMAQTKLNRLLKEQQDNQAEINRLEKFKGTDTYALGIGALETKKQNLAEEVRITRETVNTLSGITQDGIDTYNTQLQTSLKGEKKVNEDKVKGAKETAKAVKKEEEKTLTDKNKYDNALGLINQFYNEQKLIIVQSGKTKEEQDALVRDNEIANLTEQIAAAKMYYQDYTDLEIKLQELINGRPTPKAPAAGTGTSDMPKQVQDAIQLKKDIDKQFQDESIKAATDLLDGYFQTYLDGITAVTDAQLMSIDEQEKNLQESYDRRLIGKREFDIQEQQLNDKKDALEKQKKRQQAQADKQKALFDIAINTANAIVRAWISPGFPLAPGTIAAILGIAGIQTAAVLAAPIPKFKKGTLAVGGTGTEDSIHAMLQPGEAVIPTETNKKYHPAISAIYHNKIKAEDINSWVNMRLKGGIGMDGRAMTARMDTADLYTLGRIMKKNDGVYIKNVDELAGIFASLNNPRR